MTLILSLALTSWFLKDNAPPGQTLPKKDCIRSCYFNSSCAGVFYNPVESMCYQDTFVYSVDHDKKRYLDDTNEHQDYVYYEWTLDTCNEDGWKYHRQTKTCFMMVDNKKRDEAKAECISMGSELIRLKDPEKMEFGRRLAFATNTDIGTSGQEVSEGVWVWGPEDPVTPTDWKDNKTGNEKCIFLRKEGDGWDDVKCDDPKTYLCERSVTTTPQICQKSILWF